MKNIGNIIKTLQNIMRKDQGVSGDAQRIEQLGWMITLKIIDDKDTELELIQDDYTSPIPSELQWRNWAADSEGITGDALKEFVDQKLFPGLKNLDISSGNKRAVIIREIFEGTNNYMKNGTIIRQVINQLNQIDFNVSEDRHLIWGYLRKHSQRPAKRGKLRRILYTSCYYRVYDRYYQSSFG
jgi:type I restriction enzyme M protein